MSDAEESGAGSYEEQVDAAEQDAGLTGSEAEDGGAADKLSGKKRKRVATELTAEKLAEFEAAERRKGVVYLSRVPPFMKPIKIRHLLQKYGAIGRVYLAPEDPAAYRRRVKAGGNKRLQFTEGWVEFLDKHVAKAVAAMLTNQPMGGNKRGFYASDVWSIKYLKHFKWHHLTEKVAYEKRVAAAKLRAELSKAKKEAELYVSRVEQAHALEHMEAKRKGKAKGGAGAGSAAAAGGDGDGEEGDRFGGVRRSFKQRQALPDASLEALGLAPAPAAAAAAVVEGAAASGGGSGRKSTGGGKGSDSSKGEAKGHSSSGGGSGSAKRRKVGASE